MAKYNNEFYRTRDEKTRYSAKKVLSYIFSFIEVKSMCDVGCGVGTWLSQGCGILGKDIKICGLDGDYVNREYLQIEQNEFIPSNLEKRINLNRRFDLVITLEVAEHLPPQRAKTFVEDLTKLGDVILFSAAIPRQGGLGHINEQPLSYWVEKFAECGYTVFDIVRPEIWNEPKILPMYKQNCVIFAKNDCEAYQKFLNIKCDSILDIIHPDVYKNMYGISVKYKSNLKWCFFKIKETLEKEGVKGLIRVFRTRILKK